MFWLCKVVHVETRLQLGANMEVVQRGAKAEKVVHPGGWLTPAYLGTDSVSRTWCPGRFPHGT